MWAVTSGLTGPSLSDIMDGPCLRSSKTGQNLLDIMEWSWLSSSKTGPSLLNTLEGPSLSDSKEDPSYMTWMGPVSVRVRRGPAYMSVVSLHDIRDGFSLNDSKTGPSLSDIILYDIKKDNSIWNSYAYSNYWCNESGPSLRNSQFGPSFRDG